MLTESHEEQEHKLNPSGCGAEVQGLCVEFQRAIAALASNDIPALETATAAQDVLLDKLKNSLGKPPSDQPPSLRVPPSDFRELASLSKVYSGLLQRALRTSRLRAALCRTYQQNFPAQSEPVAATGWSCEV